jgi:hypothetical protein
MKVVFHIYARKRRMLPGIRRRKGYENEEGEGCGTGYKLRLHYFVTPLYEAVLFGLP